MDGGYLKGCNMNQRIETILRLARQTLGDKDKDRWSDTDLLDLLDMGHKDYAHHAQILRGVAVIPLVPNQAVYTFPGDVFKLLRVEYNNTKLRITTYDELDERASMVPYGVERKAMSGLNSDFDSFRVTADWQSDEAAEPTAIVIDKSNLTEFRTYPIVNADGLEYNYTFSNESGIELPFAGAELYGLTTKIGDYTLDSPFGVVTGLYDPFVEVEQFNQLEGVVTGAGESVGKLVIRYIKTPATLANTDAELLTPRAFDTGLKFYVVGHALRNDLDARNVDRGNQELAFYERELANAAKLVESNGASNIDRATSYRSGF